MEKAEAILAIAEYAGERYGNGQRIIRPGVDYIPVSGAIIDSDDILYTASAVLDGWFTEGPRAAEFAKDLKKEIGAPHVTLCNSGSSANLLAVTAAKEFFGFRQGKVITCATGFTTTVSPILQNGFEPLYIDVDPASMNVRMDWVYHALERDDVIGVIVAHTLGFPFDAFAVADYASGLGKFFIEDCCDALGARIGAQSVGSLGDLATLSFFPAHQITTGEGGAVFSKYGRLAKIVDSLTNWGRDCWCQPGQNNTCNRRFGWKIGDLPFGWDHKYTFSRLGYNLKMTEIQAALGITQLAKLGRFVEKRRKNFNYLYDRLCEYEEFELVQISFLQSPSPFGFPITVKPNLNFGRDDLVRYLEAHKIGTRPVFAGNLLLHPPYRNSGEVLFDDLSGTNYVMENTFWVGTWPGLDKEHLQYIVDKIGDFIDERYSQAV